MIEGRKLSRPTKKRLASDIATTLDLANKNPYVSPGSSVDSHFLDEVFRALTGEELVAKDTYRKTERLLQALGLTYDPFWDTSEAQPDGGGTVTARAFSRIQTAISGVPRCFILNVSDAPVGAHWETEHDRVYRYDETVSGRMPFNDAGPGSRVLHYATSNAQQSPQHFVSHAEVAYVGPGWTGPWTAELTAYEHLPTPVPVNGVNLPGWNRQNAITEITWATYQEIVHVGGLPRPSSGASARTDFGGDVVASRVVADFPAQDAVTEAVDVPDELPKGVLPSVPTVSPTYTETDDGNVVRDDDRTTTRSPRDRRRDKLAEERAVAIAIESLGRSDWKVERDCQDAGVGYDLLLAKGARHLKVEVKGIRGPRLAFNLTPKELWRAETDDEFVVFAVTSVLSPRDFLPNLLTRDKVLAATRVVTGYRVTM